MPLALVDDLIQEVVNSRSDASILKSVRFESLSYVRSGEERTAPDKLNRGVEGFAREEIADAYQIQNVDIADSRFVAVVDSMFSEKGNNFEFD